MTKTTQKIALEETRRLTNRKKLSLPRASACYFVGSCILLFSIYALAADRPNPAKLDDNALRIIHSHHYEIHTDLDQPLVDDLSIRMDAMYEQYGKTFADFRPATGASPLPVYLFATHEKYMAFTDYSGVNTNGLFVSGRHPYLTAYEQGQGRDTLRRTLQHEAFHQFAYFNINHHLPPWMNEGMAQLFEDGIWTGEKFLTGQIPPRRIRQLRVDIIQKHLIDFDQFLSMSAADWRDILHTNIDKAATCYSQAWAMAYFCSVDEDADYHQKFVRLLQLLHDHGNTDQVTATMRCFPDRKEFRKKFNTWAARLKATPESTMLENQDVLGDFLMTVTQKNHPVPGDVADFRRIVAQYSVKIEYTRGNFTYSSAADPMVYFSDLAGKTFKPEQLFFRAEPEAPLPQIVCQPTDGKFEYVTRFYSSAGKTEHEVVVQSLDKNPKPETRIPNE